ncbi:MAG: hypothetical protein QOF76_1796, partial [Solirubrobacteraceae bacterium]|nr:hypothetical protein [Solirubrobacteraceae bacterium]
MSITVLLADDQSMVRAGFRMILESDPDIEVVGEAANGEQAAASARRLQPDVVLMDIQMPDGDGLQATRQITESDAVASRGSALRPGCGARSSWSPAWRRKPSSRCSSTTAWRLEPSIKASASFALAGSRPRT